MNKFAAIFDMDGVLVDSVGLNWKAYNTVLADRHGIRIADEDIGDYVGMALHDQITLITQKYSVSIDIAGFEKESTLIKQELFQIVKPKEGVIRLLEQLHGASIPIALATSSPYNIAHERLTKAGIWHYFEPHITEDSVLNHKPHPDVYIAAATQLNIPTAKCVVFEDAPSGIEAAKRAGMPCVAITTPYVPIVNLHNADMLVRSLAEIDLETLERLVQ